MSNQSPTDKLPNDFGQSPQARAHKSPPTKPKAGRDPVQPNNRGNQQQN